MGERTAAPVPAAMVTLVDDESTKPPVRGLPRRMRLALLVLIGGGVGLAPVAHGLYDAGTWGVVGVFIFAALLVALVLARERIPAIVAAAPLALAALGGVQLLSQAWAESTAQAAIEGHRTLVYAAFLGLLLMLLSSAGARVLLLTCLTVLSAGVAVAIALALVTSSGPGMFFRARLFDPLGYSNGQATALLLAFWPLVAFAERQSRVVFAAPAVGLASLVAGLSVLTQSRAAMIALIASVLFMLALVPGRGLRLGIVALIAGSVALAWTSLDAVPASANMLTGRPQLDTLREAVLTTASTSAAAAALFAVAVSLVGRVHGRIAPRALRRARRTALIALTCVVAVGAAILGPTIAHGVDDRWHGFTHMEPINNSSRLGSGGGNRHDYWRVALAEWRERPVLGIGAGNYDTEYFQRRSTTEDVRQPHSLFVQTLAENGLVGLLALLAFVALIGLAAREGARRAATDRGARALTVGAGGIVVLWLVQTSVDWLHLLPGLTLATLCGVAVLLSFLRDHEPPRPMARPGARPLIFAATLVAAASLGVIVVSQWKRDAAVSLLDKQPRAALARAQDAVRLNRGDLRGYYLLAAAQARLDRYPAARASLEAAIRLEPQDFVPRALLGDLATRRGDRRLARTSYDQAARLNPRDRELQTLSAEARAADKGPGP